MGKKAIVANIWVCTDCMILHCNGDISDPPPEYDPLSLIEDNYELTAGLLAEEHNDDCQVKLTGGWPVDYECDCERNEFSTSPCDGCGSPYHGERHAMSLWA